MILRYHLCLLDTCFLRASLVGQTVSHKLQKYSEGKCFDSRWCQTIVLLWLKSQREHCQQPSDLLNMFESISKQMSCDSVSYVWVEHSWLGKLCHNSYIDTALRYAWIQGVASGYFCQEFYNHNEDTARDLVHFSSCCYQEHLLINIVMLARLVLLQGILGWTSCLT